MTLSEFLLTYSTPAKAFYIPPGLYKYKSARYICTHGGFQKSRGKGVRDHSHIRFTGCKAVVVLALRQCFKKNNEGIVVAEFQIYVKSQVGDE